MRKTKRYEFIVDGIVLYVTSGSIKEGFFLFFYCDAFCLLLWSVSEKHSSHRARWGLSWTEQNIHLSEMLKTNSELIHEIKQLNFSLHKGNTDRYETDFC